MVLPRRRGRRAPRVAVSEGCVQLGESARAVDDGYVRRLHGVHVRVLRLVRPACVSGHAESSVDGEALRRGPSADQLDYFVWASCCSQRARQPNAQGVPSDDFGSSGVVSCCNLAFQPRVQFVVCVWIACRCREER
eukprot:6174708-Pleurochrysis_carterae.AAC.2